MLKLAVHEDLIAVSPLRIKGALDDTPAREPQTATVAEVDALASAMPEQLAMAVQIAAWCGLVPEGNFKLPVVHRHAAAGRIGDRVVRSTASCRRASAARK